MFVQRKGYARNFRLKPVPRSRHQFARPDSFNSLRKGSVFVPFPEFPGFVGLALLQPNPRHSSVNIINLRDPSESFFGTLPDTSERILRNRDPLRVSGRSLG